MANLSTQNIGANYKGILNLGSTINTPLSTTLQNITDGDGNTSPLQLATNRIALGSGTISGTSLLNFPDAGTTAAYGIQFGSGTSNLYRSASGVIKTDGELNATTFRSASGVFSSNTLYDSNSAGLFLGYAGGGGGLKLLPNSGTTTFAEVRTTGEFALTPPTLTGSSATSALSITQTYNTTGNPSLIFANVTNTASGASSNLMDLQVGGVSMFKVDKSGIVNFRSHLQPSVSNACDLGGVGARFKDCYFGVVDGRRTLNNASIHTDILYIGRGASGQTANIYEARDYSQNILWSVSSSGVNTSSQYRLSSLNTAPSSASDTGTLGEIRVDANYIYICTATNTWKRVAIATW